MNKLDSRKKYFSGQIDFHSDLAKWCKWLVLRPDNLKLARKLVFSKWKEALGGNVVAIVSGGAALQPRLSRVFFGAGINVLEGYGLTETSPVIAVNNFLPNSICFGTVGPVIDKVQVKFAEDGEILVKGPNIMLGYYNRPDATAEAIDPDGWFHTGDIGTFVDNRFLKITDRKKEIFKTSGGKYITPVKIENKLKESPFIEQIMVIGENQKFASALIVPSFAYLKDYCKLKNIEYTSNEEIIKNPAIKKRILEEVDQLNKSLAQYETIKAPELLPREWSIEKNELTPKLSLKRKVILAENKELIDKIYREKRQLVLGFARTDRTLVCQFDRGQQHYVKLCSFLMLKNYTL